MSWRTANFFYHKTFLSVDFVNSVTYWINTSWKSDSLRKFPAFAFASSWQETKKPYISQESELPIATPPPKSTTAARAASPTWDPRRWLVFCGCWGGERNLAVSLRRRAISRSVVWISVSIWFNIQVTLNALILLKIDLKSLKSLMDKR